MPNEIQVLDAEWRPATIIPVKDLITRQAQVMQVMQEVMKDGVHYGTIPGCGKPSLYQPGAEKLLETFRLAARHETQDLSTPGIIRYRVRCMIIAVPSEVMLGDEYGECSSDEEKYAWRRAVCDEEFNATPADMRREKWSNGGRNGAYTTKQVRTNPADVANTVLAMACKRAKVRAARAAVAASDIFDVNIEDIPEEIRAAMYEGEQPASARSTPSEALNKRQNPRQNARTSPTAAPGSYGETVVTFGKNAGKTLAELGEKSVQWYAENANNEQLRAAAIGYLVDLKGDVPPSATEHHDAPSADYQPGGLPDITDPFSDQ